MVAVRRKVGARSVMRSKLLSKGKKVIKIDCNVPAADGIFDTDMLTDFEQHFSNNTKLNGRKGKLGDKVKIDLSDNILTVSTTVAYRKKYFKYLTKKFLKKKNLRDWLRVIAHGKQHYHLKYYNIQDNQEEAQE